MGKHIVFVGSGAVGSYVAGRLTQNGQDVSLVCLRPETVRHLREDGLHITDSQRDDVVRVSAFHLHEVQTFLRHPIDIAILAVKCFDTAWACALVSQYLAPRGFVVSMQNGINEETIASVVGWGRTTGCVLSGIGVNNYGPGKVQRNVLPGGNEHTVFRVGEVNGRTTPRIAELAQLLSVVDSAAVTSDLWGERWTKLVINALGHGPVGAAGGNFDGVWRERGTMHHVAIKIAAEAIAVGRALGFVIGPIYGATANDWLAAAEGEVAALEAVDEGLKAEGKRQVKPTATSVGRDLERGLRSEIDYTCGLVALKATELGMTALVNAAVTGMIKQIERGALQRDPRNLDAFR